MTKAKHQNEDREIYIVVSQTGTILSLILKLVTGAEYNHSSISLDKTMHTMYSFGRKNPYHALPGAFVKESPEYGTFKRFKNTEAKVVKMTVTEEQYNELSSQLRRMWRHREEYHYNYIGLLFGMFHRKKKRDYYFYCSEFVAELLKDSGIVAPDTFGTIVKPIDFLDLPGTEQIYQGKLQKYSA